MNEKYLEADCEGMSAGTPPEPCIVVIFGASGDLAHRELVPSLYALACQKLLPERFAVVGFARKEWDDEAFREDMRRAVKKDFDFCEEAWKAFAQRLFYVSGDFNAGPSQAYAELNRKIKKARNEYQIPDNVLFHLSTPPSYYGTIVQKLEAAGLAKSGEGWRRVIIEKPFGESERSARALDMELRKIFDEEQIYRVDHYLGKETVQNMLVFRFANPGFEPIWNRNYVDHVQITVAEDIGIGTRADFYEKTGVVRDMVQNHLLQLLCMAAIEPPVNFDASSLRAETVEVLKAIRPVNIKSECVLGQYGAGELNGQKVRAYRNEEDVDKDSNAPTFAALKLMLDNWRWADVPFYLRTGKRMAKKLAEVTIQFKPTPHLMFPLAPDQQMLKNVLTFRLQPDEGIVHTFLAKQPGAAVRMRPVKMNFRYDRAFGIENMPSAYQWLLLDAMQGDQTLFPHADWIYEAWSLIDPIVERWESAPWLELQNYAAGSWGPVAAEELIKRDGREWFKSSE